MRIKVYICPTEGCGNYFGSSSSPDLSQAIVGQNGQNFEKRPPSQWHSRAECPDCRARGQRVERILIELDSPIPAVVAA